MPPERQHPARRPRISEADTRDRMLTAALALLAERGVTVGLDGLLLEDVIRRADVSRTSAYRRWPTRDAFLADVLLEVARGVEDPTIGPRVVAEARAALRGSEMDPSSAQGRRDLLVELLRLMFRADLAGVVGSPRLTAYLVLRAAFAGVPDPDLRDALGRELRRAEQRTVARGAAVVAAALPTLGLRLVHPLTGPEGCRTVARAVSATTTGFAVAALADPDLVAATTPLAPFGTTRTADWSVPVLTLTGLVLNHLEPDPAGPPLDPAAVSRALQSLVDAGQTAAAAMA